MATGTAIDYKLVRVGGAEYKIIPLSPDRAIDFCTDAMTALAPLLTAVEMPSEDSKNYAAEFAMKAIPNLGLVNSEKLKAMFSVIRDQMMLPNNQPASDPVAYQEWFASHPSHLLEVHVKGLFATVKDFFPQELGMLLGVPSSKES